MVNNHDKVNTEQARALEHVEFLLKQDAASNSLGIKILWADLGKCNLSLEVSQQMVQGHGICHGGYLFLLADTALAFAANTYGDACVVSSANVEFLLPAKQGDVLIAKAREQHKYKRSGLYDVSIFNQKEDIIALYRGKSHQLAKPDINHKNTFKE